MKTIISLLSLGFVIIIVCLVYLLRSGVSIRTAPIIKPSIVSPDFTNVPQGLFLRLFPDIQQSHYILWSVSQNSAEVQQTLSIMKERAEKELRQPVQFIYNGPKATLEEVKACARPCWILFPEDQANELKSNDWINTRLKPLDRPYFTISWIAFHRDITVPEPCIKEKRLDLECLKVVSIQEVRRKMKEESARYFFMRKYMDSDYFLFLEDPK
ncbi:hypothetical protein AZI86_13620 [Bdellovibrio bacteriovorus]|uniref:Uncharacterized protein n=1 Tax=Bdellovibrio bacteriovorus TaxID=959 RepID=A0A150WJF8_BDEBC|nr:hypothetical protein [Bdellovibrio bacteriovorus]KYG63852.1 hypothetical protein AZI86_13620 [Bdellovibrio bacteriovorus]